MNIPIIIKPDKPSGQLSSMLASIISAGSFEITGYQDELRDLRNRKLVLAVELDPAGNSPETYGFISRLSQSDPYALSASSAMLLIHSPNELNTKSNAANILFQLNQLGCRFFGHPVVEATGSLHNFLTWQKTIDRPLEDICSEICRSSASLFLNSTSPKHDKPNILVLHSSAMETSNTLALWGMVKKHLYGCDIAEFHVENGKVLDCIGCSFKTCIHFSSRKSCFYGGPMVEHIYPAIEKADSIIWLCPNYNDSISANLMAVINRMTALYRRTPFYSKSFFSVIVSGNSGGDSVAKQLIDSLCINKGFILPPRAALFATANDPGSVYGIPGIDKSAEIFAANILGEIKSDS